MNNEGRAQRYFQVFVPEGEVQAGWRWLRDITAAAVGVTLVVGYPAIRDGVRYNIAGVLRDGPADLAGIQPGDVVERINGRKVDNARAAMTLIAQAGPGKELLIEGVREGKPFQGTVVTGPRPER